jgi:hypothetical protein
VGNVQAAGDCGMGAEMVESDAAWVVFPGRSITHAAIKTNAATVLISFFNLNLPCLKFKSQIYGLSSLIISNAVVVE